MTNGISQANDRVAVTGVAGATVPYGSLRDPARYDPFRRFFSSVDPAIEVLRTENGYEVEIPVAGFTSDQIEIVAKDDILTLSGKSERRSFTRSLQLPDEIDTQAIEASIANGMLSLTLRRHPNAEPRRITITQK